MPYTVKKIFLLETFPPLTACLYLKKLTDIKLNYSQKKTRHQHAIYLALCGMPIGQYHPVPSTVRKLFCICLRDRRPLSL